MKNINEILTEDDIKFLRELGKELKTQERYGTAKPVFIQIRQQKEEIGVDPDYADYTCIIIGDEYDLFRNFDEAVRFCEEHFGFNDEQWEEIKELESFTYLADYIEERGYYASVTGYREEYSYDNCFLTIKACQEHIDQNYYHYDDPKIYVNHAWRNSELAQLLKIVEKFADI